MLSLLIGYPVGQVHVWELALATKFLMTALDQKSACLIRFSPAANVSQCKRYIPIRSYRFKYRTNEADISATQIRATCQSYFMTYSMRTSTNSCEGRGGDVICCSPSSPRRLSVFSLFWFYYYYCDCFF